MQRTENITLTMSYTDLKGLLAETFEELMKKAKEHEKAPPDWEKLSLGEAAEELKCSKKTIRRKMKKLKITGLLVGRELMLQRRDLKKIEQDAGKQRAGQPS